jgi:hypothetical protein
MNRRITDQLVVRMVNNRHYSANAQIQKDLDRMVCTNRYVWRSSSSHDTWSIGR